jgi:L-asparagine oxygenase
MFEPTALELNTIISLANQLTISPSDKPDSFCKLAKKISDGLPDRLKQALNEFINSGTETEFLLIDGLTSAICPLADTPSNNSYKVGEKTTLAKIQAICVSYIGEMISYEAEGYGRLFQDVVPTQCMEKKQTSLGSNTELEIHTEQAFSDLKPDILSLACLRGDPAALTYILPVKTILEHLTDEERVLLRQPLWKTGVDLSFKLDGHEFKKGDIRGPMSILSGDLARPTLVFDQDLMRGLTQKSNDMVKKIVDIYYNHRVWHNLKPGQIIFIDNRHAVHGRSPFFPNYDGLDRFLVRCFATLDYMKSNYARQYDCRTVSAIYS